MDSKNNIFKDTITVGEIKAKVRKAMVEMTPLNFIYYSKFMARDDVEMMDYYYSLNEECRHFLLFVYLFERMRRSLKRAASLDPEERDAAIQRIIRTIDFGERVLDAFHKSFNLFMNELNE